MPKRPSCCLPCLRHTQDGWTNRGWWPWHSYLPRTANAISSSFLPFVNSKQLRSTVASFSCVWPSPRWSVGTERHGRASPGLGVGALYLNLLPHGRLSVVLLHALTCGLHSSRTKICLGKIHVSSDSCWASCVVVLVSVRSIAASLLTLSLF